MKNLEEIRGGSRVLVDANVILYGIRRTSPQCRNFLVRCDSGAIEGFVTTIVIAEVAHRRMMEEAQAKAYAGPSLSRSLAQHPDIVRQLTAYAEDVRDLLDGGLFVENTQAEDFYLSLELQRQFGLPTNDSLNLAVARRLGINEIATADRAFDSAQGFIVYKPGDISQ